jgi:hypothetical protein
MYGAYTLSTNKLKVLIKKVERVRNKVNTSQYTETSTLFNYAATHSFPIMVKTFNGNGSQLITKYKYARDYGAPGAATSVKQVNMIDTLNLQGRYGTLVEKTSSVIPPGGSEKTVEGTLYLFDNFGTAASIVPLPKETMSLSAGEGITGLFQSSFSGSGASRTFTKNGAYRTVSQVRYRKRTFATYAADPIRSEGAQRQFESHHTDITSGVTALKALNVEPHEIIYSSFDHDTDYDFDLNGFTAVDQAASGKTGISGLKGFTQTSTTKYLRKQITKKPGAKYVFGAWYKAPVTAFTHSLKLTIKSTSDAVLQEYTYPTQFHPQRHGITMSL